MRLVFSAQEAIIDELPDGEDEGRPMKFNYQYVQGAFKKALEEDRLKIAKAATAAVREAGETIQREGRRDIASAGFTSKRWQEGWRADMVSPKPGQPPTIDAAVLVRHRLAFASVFETGATIKGEPLLWLPIEQNLPPGRWSPRRYARDVGPLVSVNLPGKRPMLFGKRVRFEPGRARRRAMLGKIDVRERKPLFVGVPTVTLRRRFHIRDIVKRVVARLAEFYTKNMKV